MQRRTAIQCAVVACSIAATAFSAKAEKPNVVIVITVERDGEYEISLRRWPAEADKGINDGTYGKAFHYKQARLRIGDVDETKDIPAGAKEVSFRLALKKGITHLAPVFIGPDLTATPCYAYVTHKPTLGWQTPQGMGIPVYDPTYGRVPPQKKK